MRKNGISKNEIKLDTEIRKRQIPNASGIERTVVTIVVNEMRLRKLPASCRDRFADHVETVVILLTDRAGWIEQKIPFVAAKIEHALAAPVWMIKLRVEICKLRGLDALRAQCL